MTEIDESKKAAIRYLSMVHPNESRSQVEERLQEMVDGAKKAGQRTVCANCEWSGPLGKTQPIKDLASRLEPGDIVPAGECPECGALCYLSVPKWLIWLFRHKGVT